MGPVRQAPAATAAASAAKTSSGLKLGMASGAVMGSMFCLCVVAAGYGSWLRSRGIDPMDKSHIPRSFISQRVENVVNKDAHVQRALQDSEDRIRKNREKKAILDLVGGQYVERAS